MALCRIYARTLRDFSQRTLIKHNPRQHTVGNKAAVVTQHYFTNKGSYYHTHNSPIIYEQSKFFDESSTWRKYITAFAGVSGALLLLKLLSEEVKCKEIEKPESPSPWKGVKIKLYQYQTCPFCTKARTFMKYYQIPFEIIEVHPIFKKEIKFSKKYKKVPIVTVETKDGTLELQDSSLIVSILSSYVSEKGRRSFAEIANDYPTTEITNDDGIIKDVVLNKYWVLEEEPDKPTHVLEDDPRLIEVRWREWTDDHLVHLISPNVYRTYVEAYQAFAHHVKQGKFNGTWEGVVAKVFGSFAMWMISKKLKKKYNMQDDVRIDLYKACNKWTDVIGKDKFMGGNEPNLADLSVYAVLSVMEGLVSFDDLSKYTKIKPWYFRVKNAVDEKQQNAIRDRQTLACITSTVPSG